MWEGWKLGVKEVEKEGVGNGEIIGEYGSQKLCYFFIKLRDVFKWRSNGVVLFMFSVHSE